ncbi:MAG: aromatic amino acid lyase, partial [Alistipes sp.]|nr:aromatic amino acid lyase [Alistipes sp.]
MKITHQLTRAELERILIGREHIEIASETRRAVEECYRFLADFSKDKVIYGINTGFGPMAQWRIDDADLEALQYNIIRSHSTGAGEPLDEACVRAAMVARLMTFLQAHSGVHVDTVDLLAEMLNHEIYP